MFTTVNISAAKLPPWWEFAPHVMRGHDAHVRHIKHISAGSKNEPWFVFDTRTGSMKPEPKFVNAGQAARICGLKYSTLRRMLEDGKIPFYRFGKIRMLKASELESALEAYRVAPTSEVLS
jgi:excisionase family DNA binding protein